MNKIELPSITSGYNLSTINSNFQKIEDALNEEVLYRKSYLGEPNEMQSNLDMNSNRIINVSVGSGPGDLVTKGYVDQQLSTKFDKTGGPLSGGVQMQNNRITGLPNATQQSEPATYAQLLQVESGTDSLLRNDLAAASGSSLVGFTQGSPGSSIRTSQDKFRDVVSLKDFGVVGNGVVDDTAPIQQALNSAKHVIVPAGLTPLISATITVPVCTKLEFLGGLGNTPNQLPASYLIKKSTMTTAGIVVSERGEVVGGGISCQAGNSGDGIHLAGNSARLLDFYAVGAGRDGIRVGTDGVFVNCNSVYQYRNRSTDNGRYGIYIHDGVSVGPADANIGSLVDCVAHRNGADGIRLGHCFWTTVQNCNTEGNTGYGLYLSGAANSTYPECRWPIIIGGDFNEGNNGTNNVDQVYDGSYFATFIVSDSFSTATDAPTALQGGGLRNTFSPRANAVVGMTVNASAGGIDATPLVVENVQTGGNTYPSVVRQKTFASNGSGPGIKFKIDPNTGTYVDAAAVTAIQNSPGKYGPRLTGYNAGSPVYVALDTSVAAFYPGTDNAISCGHNSLKWSVVYSWTGTINTSDAREKTAPISITDAVLDAWGDVHLITFQWLDAIQKKGEDVARWHFGVIAQQVRDAFIAHGLDGTRYGLLCYDEWEDEYEPVMEEFEEEVTVIDGKGRESTEVRISLRESGDMKLVRTAGNRWGIRADQCLFLEAAYQRRRCDRIEGRLAALELVSGKE